jgi:cellulose synthase operon protein C
MNQPRHPRAARLGLTFAACCGLAACTTVGGGERTPLDNGEWRSAKSRMYQDLARQCLQAEDHDRAQRLLQQAVQFDANDARSLELLAQLAHADGDLQTASNAAQMLLRLQPESVAAWCTLGAVAEAHNEPGNAEAAYRRALANAGDDPRPGIDLHRLLLAQQRAAEADALRADLLTRFPRRIEPRLDHAAHLAAAGSWHESTAEFDRALTLQPDDAAAASGMALGAVMSRQPAAALALIDRLPPRASVENPSLQLTLAVAHLQSGDCDAALRALEFTDPVLADRVSMRVLRGEILFRLQRLDAAQVEFERALALAPDTARAHAGIGRIQLLQHQPHAAVRSLQRAAQIEPAKVSSQALLTAALVATGDLDAARRQLELVRRRPGATALIDELLRLHPQLAEEQPGSSR